MTNDRVSLERQKYKDMPQISLMIIGAQKAGTSSLKEYLGKHPQICTHKQLEMAYFSKDTLYEQGFPLAYDRFFHCDDSDKFLLAKNVEIIYSPTAMTRLKEHNKNIQVAIMLRNPVDRAYSAYWYNRRMGWETILSFEEAFYADPKRFGGDEQKRNSCAYLERSLYIHQIPEVYKVFSKDQVSIYLLEDMKKDANLLCQTILHRIDGIDSSIDLTIERRHNAAALPKNPIIAKATSSPEHFRAIKDLLRKTLPNRYVDAFRDWLIKKNEQRFVPPPINQDIRAKLVEYFAPYNNQLSDMINRDLTHWNS
jgi:hypothetical protein